MLNAFTITGSKPINTENDDTELEKGWYYKAILANTVIAVSTEKKLVERYMTKNRNVDPSMYEIEKSRRLESRESYRLLEQFYDTYLPVADKRYLYYKLYKEDWSDLKKEYSNLLSEISRQYAGSKPYGNFYTKAQLALLMRYIRKKDATTKADEKAHCIGAVVRLAHPIAFNDDVVVYMDYYNRYIVPYTESKEYASKSFWNNPKRFKKVEDPLLKVTEDELNDILEEKKEGDNNDEVL